MTRVREVGVFQMKWSIPLLSGEKGTATSQTYLKLKLVEDFYLNSCCWPHRKMTFKFTQLQTVSLILRECFIIGKKKLCVSVTSCALQFHFFLSLTSMITL